MRCTYQISRVIELVLSVAVAVAGSLPAFAMQVHRFDIPEESASAAIRDFGAQAHVQILVAGDNIKGKKLHAVHGSLSTEDALGRLLSGSGLSARYVGDGSIALLPAGFDESRQAAAGITQANANGATPGQFLLAQAAQGQVSGSLENSASGNSTAAEPKIEEIVVTAQRREEPLNKVPLSITALSQGTLDDLHLQTLADVATVVPGLVLPLSGAGSQADTQVVIRGIYSSDNAATTGVYIDETPIVVRQMYTIGYSGTPQPDLFDLDRLEVLRGPQGTLFGSGAMGGAVRYITPQPDLNSASGYTRSDVSYTQWGAPSFDVGVAYGSPVTPGTSAFRVSGWYRDTGGFIDTEDPYTGQILKKNANSSHSIVLRPAFTIAPTDGLTITPAVFIQRHDSSEPNEYWANGLPYIPDNGFVSGFGRQVEQSVQDNLTVSSLAVKYNFAQMTLQSDTSYIDRFLESYDDFSNIINQLFGEPAVIPALSEDAAYQKNDARTQAWQQEFRLSSNVPGSKVSWVAGLYYRHAVDSVTQYTSDLDAFTLYAFQAPASAIFGLPPYVADGQTWSLFGTSSATTEQRAIFGDVTAEILPHLKASVGIRAEDSVIKNQQGITNNTEAISLPDDVEHPVTPKFSLTYQINDDAMVYATVAKGYRTGGSNSPLITENEACNIAAHGLGFSSVPTTFSSDHLWSYEIGTKDSWFNQRVALQGSVFYIDWSKIQTSILLEGNCYDNFTTNLGKAVSQGFDLQFAAILAEGLKFSANVGYTDAYYPNATYNAPLTNGSGTVTGQGSLINAAGDKLPDGVPWTASGVLDYSVSIDPYWNNARSYLRVDYRWLDGTTRVNPLIAGYNPLTSGYANESYGLLNLRLGVTRDKLDLSLFVNNAANANPRLGYKSENTPPVSFEPVFFAVALPPRTVGLTALYHF
jgi:iron complex outermembrane recepter protein